MAKDEKEEKEEGELLLPQERREYPRVAISVNVHYRLLDGDEADRALTKHFDPEKIFTKLKESHLINVSTTGLLMYVHENIPEKEFVAVSMYLPLPGLSCNCKALAEVIRCDADEKTAGHFIVALKFLKVIHHNLNKFKFMSLNDVLEIKGGEDLKLY